MTLEPTDGPSPPAEAAAARLPPIGVPAWAVLPAILLVAVGYVLISAVVGAVIGLTGGDLDKVSDSEGLTIGLTIALDLVLIAAPIVIVSWLTHRPPNPAAFGLRIPDWRPALKSMFGVYVAFWAVTLIVALIVGQPEDQEIVRELKAEESVAVLAGFVAMTCVAAPIAEEFFFRGFVFRVLWERTNVSVATVATGIAFGLVHAPDADWIGVGVLAFLGAALCVLLWRTASLLPCIMLHSFHNSISFGATKELPWWGFLLLTAGCVTTTYAISLLATRLGRRVVAPPAPA